MMQSLASLRQSFVPQVFSLLQDVSALSFEESPANFSLDPSISERFPHSKGFKTVQGKKSSKKQHSPLRVGVVFSGGQAAGGHNVIAGLFDALLELNKDSKLFGFLNGPSGIIEGKAIPITQELLKGYRNMGGFDLIGSGRTKIETLEQMQSALNTVKELHLNGLVVIGGDDSNTNAALLAEFFLQHKQKTFVIGVPKTIDGDLKNEAIDVSFGFDTACKIYSEIIGNIGKDCLSAKKYYHFIKLMGRSASHIALECALKTHPNLTLISEEVMHKNMSLASLVQGIADMIVKRAEKNKNYGIVLIPEGLIEFIPEFKTLIAELNATLAKDPTLTAKTIPSSLSKPSADCFHLLPELIKQQLTLDRDPHGNVQVSLIETERMIVELVKEELLLRKKNGSYKGKFSPINHFLGYEGRAAYPSNFDCTYCYCLGKAAAALIAHEHTGYIVSIKQLHQPVAKWQLFATPLIQLIHLEIRKGVQKPVIKKALVDLNGKPFKAFSKERSCFELEDRYLSPGPIQYFGLEALTDEPPLTLLLEKS